MSTIKPLVSYEVIPLPDGTCEVKVTSEVGLPRTVAFDTIAEAESWIFDQNERVDDTERLPQHI